jgi:type IV secretion system protein VirB6
MLCPSISIGRDAHLADALASIDCQLDAGVAQAYGKLFASGGAFSAVLSAVLTIYIAVLAFGFVTGRTSLTLRALTPRVLALCLVLSFATSWPAYHAVFDALLRSGPDQIASTVMGTPGGATKAFASRLDVLFDHVLEASRSISSSAQNPPLDAIPAAQNANVKVANQLIWASGLTLAFCTIGLLIVARVILTVVLALGPVFIVLGLFDNTRGLFVAWARTAISFALSPLLIVLGGGTVLAVLAPMVSAIASDPDGAVADLHPVVMLFLGTMIYAALIGTAAWTAFSLTRGWRLKSADAPDTDKHSPEKLRTGGAVVTFEDRNARLLASISATSVTTPIPAALAIAAGAQIARHPVKRAATVNLGQKFRSSTPLTKFAR